MSATICIPYEFLLIQNQPSFPFPKVFHTLHTNLLQSVALYELTLENSRVFLTIISIAQKLLPQAFVTFHDSYKTHKVSPGWLQASLQPGGLL